MALISKDKRDWASIKEKDLDADIRKYYIILCNNTLTKRSILEKFPESEFFISPGNAPNYRLPIVPIKTVEKNITWFENLAKIKKDDITFYKATKDSTIRNFIERMNSKKYLYEIGNLIDQMFEFDYELPFS